MRAAVAERRRRIRGVAEGTVERRAVLRRVRHDRDLREAGVVQRFADPANAPVHHVRRRDDVGAGRGVRQRRSHELLDRRIVRDLLVDQNAAMAVRRVLAEADVGDDEHPRHLALEGANRRLDRRLRIVGGRPDVVFRVGQPEEQHARDAVSLGRRRFFHGLVHRELIDARHRSDFTPLSLAGHDEERIEKHIRRQPRLADHRAERRRAAQPARPAAQIELRAVRLRVRGRGRRPGGHRRWLVRVSACGFPTPRRGPRVRVPDRSIPRARRRGPEWCSARA